VSKNHLYLVYRDSDDDQLYLVDGAGLLIHQKLLVVFPIYEVDEDLHIQRFLLGSYDGQRINVTIDHVVEPVRFINADTSAAPDEVLNVARRVLKPAPGVIPPGFRQLRADQLGGRWRAQAQVGELVCLTEHVEPAVTVELEGPMTLILSWDSDAVTRSNSPHAGCVQSCRLMDVSWATYNLGKHLKDDGTIRSGKHEMCLFAVNGEGLTYAQYRRNIHEYGQQALRSVDGTNASRPVRLPLTKALPADVLNVDNPERRTWTEQREQAESPREVLNLPTGTVLWAVALREPAYNYVSVYLVPAETTVQATRAACAVHGKPAPVAWSRPVTHLGKGQLLGVVTPEMLGKESRAEVDPPMG
jgi:hypothetical protein